ALPDSGGGVAVIGRGGVEYPRSGATDPAPTATITIDRKTLDDVMLGEAQFPALLQSGAIRVEGDRMAFLAWFALHPPADPRFNVVVP
ncbi:MAG TPA: alkyl sulfatase C-terminal domain-containing protein, partial [Sphingopyxis sp.]|nr:alkyl sulfatase C-terminal domain-containing protein [Sphingopyxis sp.]